MIDVYVSVVRFGLNLATMKKFPLFNCPTAGSGALS